MKNTFFAFFLLLFCRLTSQNPGDLDLSFNQFGTVTINNDPISQAKTQTLLLPDGKLMIASFGYATFSGFTSMEWIRLLPDGSTDSSFGTKGRKPIPIFTSYCEFHQIVLTTDGKILLAGDMRRFDTNFGFVAKFNQNGNLDSSFAQNGVFILDVSPQQDYCRSLIVKPDDKLLLGGSTHIGDTINNSDMLLVQLMPNGTPDPNFGVNGIMVLNTSVGDESIKAMDLQADGKVVVAAEFSDSNFDIQILRMLPNGSLDPDFGDNGRKVFGAIDQRDLVYDITVQDDQKIVFCGAFSKSQLEFDVATVFRILPNGDLDSDFGNDGQAELELGFSEFAESLLIQPNGQIVIGAISVYSSFAPVTQSWIIRMNTNGTLDDGFGNGGRVSGDPFFSFSRATMVLQQPDGKLILSNTSVFGIYIVRYLNDGSIAIKDPRSNDLSGSCFPNPVSDRFTVSWEQQKAASVEITLYDAFGRQVQTLLPASALQQSGTVSMDFLFDPKLPAGQYFISIKADSGCKMLPIIKA